MKLSDEQIINIIKTYRKNTIGPDDKDVTSERAEALDRYHGREYGNEEENFSQVVTKDLAETVGWILPSIMKVLLQSGALAEFDPVGEEDVEQAEQETAYTNHVIMKDNPGFLVVYDAIWDALVLKNGYIKHYPTEETKVREREVKDVTPDELTLMLFNYQQNGKKVEILSRETDEEDFTGKIRITTELKREVIEAVPPEELRISAQCRGSIKESNFVEHIPVKYRYELIDMGMDKEWVKGLPEKGAKSNTTEYQSRSTSGDEDDEYSLLIDRSMDIMDYAESYLMVDADGDGVAELRKVISVDNRIPPGEGWNEVVDTIPFAGGTGKRIPHRHLGEGLNDDLEDLALIHTTLLRQALDNIYHTNHISWLTNDRVDDDTFLQAYPGSQKRVHGLDPVDGAAKAIEIPSILDKILPAIDYIETRKSNRTGIDRSTTGLDPDILRESTKGAFLENLNRASQKVEMITRMLSETLIKELVLGVHKDIIENQDIERVVKLTGKYIPVKPDEWEERTDLTVKVGLGSGSNEERLQKLSLLQTLQDKMYEKGLAGPEELHALFVDMAKAVEAQAPDKYVIDPQDEKFQQNKAYLIGKGMEGQSNPLAEAEQIKGQYKLETEKLSLEYKAQVEMMKESNKAQIEQLKEAHRSEVELLRADITHSHKMHELASKEAIAAMHEEIKAAIEGLKIDLGKPGIGAGVQQ